MSDIKAKALHQAVKTLEALGVQFKVIDNEGNHFGTLEVVKPKKYKPNYGLFVSIYKPKLETLQVGDVAEFEMADKKSAVEFRSALSGAASNKFGPGNCITSVQGNLVEILRIN